MTAQQRKCTAGSRAKSNISDFDKTRDEPQSFTTNSNIHYDTTDLVLPDLVQSSVIAPIPTPNQFSNHSSIEPALETFPDVSRNSTTAKSFVETRNSDDVVLRSKVDVETSTGISEECAIAVAEPEAVPTDRVAMETSTNMADTATRSIMCLPDSVVSMATPSVTPLAESPTTAGSSTLPSNAKNFAEDDCTSSIVHDFTICITVEPTNGCNPPLYNGTNSID